MSGNFITSSKGGITRRHATIDNAYRNFTWHAHVKIYSSHADTLHKLLKDLINSGIRIKETFLLRDYSNQTVKCRIIIGTENIQSGFINIFFDGEDQTVLQIDNPDDNQLFISSINIAKQNYQTYFLEYLYPNNNKKPPLFNVKEDEVQALASAQDKQNSTPLNPFPEDEIEDSIQALIISGNSSTTVFRDANGSMVAVKYFVSTKKEEKGKLKYLDHLGISGFRIFINLMKLYALYGFIKEDPVMLAIDDYRPPSLTTEQRPSPTLFKPLLRARNLPITWDPNSPQSLSRLRKRVQSIAENEHFYIYHETEAKSAKCFYSRTGFKTLSLRTKNFWIHDNKNEKRIEIYIAFIDKNDELNRALQESIQQSIDSEKDDRKNSKYTLQ